MAAAEEHRVAMRDGVELFTVVLRPGGASRAAPVLLSRTPYDLSSVLAAPDPRRFTDAGYIVVLQDCRGTSRSDGIWRPLECEVEDGADTVDWIRAQSWCNGKVGTFGSSYGASAQYLALRGGARLDAAVPASSTADFAEARFATGGPLRLSFNVIWAAQVASQAMRRSGIREPALDHLVDDMDFARIAREGRWAEALERIDTGIRPLVSHRPLRELSAFRRTAPWFYDWLFDEDRDRPLWRRLSPIYVHDRIDVPALHVAGWFDCNVEGTIANYRGLRGVGTRASQRLVLGPWRHWYPTETLVGELDFGPAAARSMPDLAAAWFDAHLNGTAAAGASVEIFVMGRNAWREETEWPPARATDTDCYLASDGHANTLAGDGTLRPEPPETAPFDTFDYDPADPVPAAGGRLFTLGERAGSFDQRGVEGRPDVLVYTSAPLAQNVEVAGLVTADIWLASSAVDTDVTVKLVDVHPDGRAMNVLDGVARARTGHPTPLVAGRPYRYRIRLGHTAQLFFAGHRLRVEVSSSSYPQYEPNPNTGQRTGSFADTDVVVAHQQVHHDATHPSVIRLPVLGAGPW